jgi:pilus assembly protein Flp/PilA
MVVHASPFDVWLIRDRECYPLIWTLETEDAMNHLALTLLIKLQNLRDREDGQDLVEYALLVALVAFGVTAALKNLGTGLNRSFSTISSTLSSSLT